MLQDHITYSPCSVIHVWSRNLCTKNDKMHYISLSNVSSHSSSKNNVYTGVLLTYLWWRFSLNSLFCGKGRFSDHMFHVRNVKNAPIFHVLPLMSCKAKMHIGDIMDPHDSLNNLADHLVEFLYIPCSNHRNKLLYKLNILSQMSIFQQFERFVCTVSSRVSVCG